MLQSDAVKPNTPLDVICSLLHQDLLNVSAVSCLPEALAAVLITLDPANLSYDNAAWLLDGFAKALQRVACKVASREPHDHPRSEEECNAAAAVKPCLEASMLTTGWAISQFVSGGAAARACHPMNVLLQAIWALAAPALFSPSVLVTVGVASVAGSSTGSKEAHKKLQSQVLDEHNKEVHKAIQGVSTSVLQLLGAAWSEVEALEGQFAGAAPEDVAHAAQGCKQLYDTLCGGLHRLGTIAMDIRLGPPSPTASLSTSNLSSSHPMVHAKMRTYAHINATWTPLVRALLPNRIAPGMLPDAACMRLHEEAQLSLVLHQLLGYLHHALREGMQHLAASGMDEAAQAAAASKADSTHLQVAKFWSQHVARLCSAHPHVVRTCSTALASVALLTSQAVAYMDGYQHHPDAPHLQAVAHCGKFAAHMRDIILLQLCVSLMLALPGAEGGEAGEGQAGRLGMQNVSESVRELLLSHLLLSSPADFATALLQQQQQQQQQAVSTAHSIIHAVQHPPASLPMLTEDAVQAAGHVGMPARVVLAQAILQVSPSMPGLRPALTRSVLPWMLDALPRHLYSQALLPSKPQPSTMAPAAAGASMLAAGLTDVLQRMQACCMDLLVSAAGHAGVDAAFGSALRVLCTAACSAHPLQAELAGETLVALVAGLSEVGHSTLPLQLTAAVADQVGRLAAAEAVAHWAAVAQAGEDLATAAHATGACTSATSTTTSMAGADASISAPGSGCDAWAAACGAGLLPSARAARLLSRLLVASGAQVADSVYTQLGLQTQAALASLSITPAQAAASAAATQSAQSGPAQTGSTGSVPAQGLARAAALSVLWSAWAAAAAADNSNGGGSSADQGRCPGGLARSARSCWMQEVATRLQGLVALIPEVVAMAAACAPAPANGADASRSDPLQHSYLQLTMAALLRCVEASVHAVGPAAAAVAATAQDGLGGLAGCLEQAQACGCDLAHQGLSSAAAMAQQTVQVAVTAATPATTPTAAGAVAHAALRVLHALLKSWPACMPMLASGEAPHEALVPIIAQTLSVLTWLVESVPAAACMVAQLLAPLLATAAQTAASDNGMRLQALQPLFHSLLRTHHWAVSFSALSALAPYGAVQGVRLLVPGDAFNPAAPAPLSCVLLGLANKAVEPSLMAHMQASMQQQASEKQDGAASAACSSMDMVAVLRYGLQVDGHALEGLLMGLPALAAAASSNAAPVDGSNAAANNDSAPATGTPEDACCLVRLLHAQGKQHGPAHPLLKALSSQSEALLKASSQLQPPFPTAATAPLAICHDATQQLQQIQMQGTAAAMHGAPGARPMGQLPQASTVTPLPVASARSAFRNAEQSLEALRSSLGGLCSAAASGMYEGEALPLAAARLCMVEVGNAVPHLTTLITRLREMRDGVEDVKSRAR